VQKKLTQVVGISGVALYVVFFIRNPNFPTPDKLLLFSTLLFMAFSQGWELFKRLAPFVLLLAVYESFRSIADVLNTHVNFTFMPAADRFMFFGALPTQTLQQWWWRGSVQWYDIGFYLVYMLHFVLPIGLAILVWKTRTVQYWRFIATYVVLSFAGFLTFLLFPAGPPWMASEKGIIPPLAHVSTFVWGAIGLKDVPSLYAQINPNPVAAVPSLHAAYATLFSLFAITLYKTKWRYATLVYPLLIYVGTVYTAEHYVIDVVAGIVFALVAYKVTPSIMKVLRPRVVKVARRTMPLRPRAVEAAGDPK
jgi:hypothetical protein